MTTEKKYEKGFNNGYVLAKHEPGLLQTVSKNLSPQNLYLKGLFAGKGQFEFEKQMNVLQEFELIRNQSKANEKVIGKMR